jgi:hypothetical protein
VTGSKPVHNMLSLLIIESLLKESISISGVPITRDEKISCAAVRHTKTGEVIECDWHAAGREEAWDRGWYAPVLAKLADEGKRIPDNLRQFFNMYDYELLDEVTEDGFMTTKNRFLSRGDALQLARDARQLNANRSGMSWDEEDPYLRAEEVKFEVS